MTRKRQLADALREGLAGAAGRGRVLGQALKVRAEIAASRRQLKAALGELGNHVYSRIKAGDLPAAAGAEGDETLLAYTQRIDGCKADICLKEAELREIVRSGRGENGESRAESEPRVT